MNVSICSLSVFFIMRTRTDAQRTANVDIDTHEVMAFSMSEHPLACAIGVAWSAKQLTAILWGTNFQEVNKPMLAVCVYNYYEGRQLSIVHIERPRTVTLDGLRRLCFLVKLPQDSTV